MQLKNNEKYKNYFENKKYNITTFGCQMNEHDSERISYILEDLGYTKTDDRNDADFRDSKVQEIGDFERKEKTSIMDKLKEYKGNLVVNNNINEINNNEPCGR